MDEPTVRRTFTPERTMFFSDGVFAIAITLLVIELRLPDSGAEGSLASGLVALWPRFLSFVISFLLVAVVWFNHHLLFHRVDRVDHKAILLNLLLLFNIIGMPFVSDVLGSHLVSADPFDATLSALIYGGWITWGGVAFNLVWWAVSGTPGLSSVGLEHRRALGFHFIRGPLLYGLATLSALASVWVSLTAFLMLIILFFLPAPDGPTRRQP